MLIRKTFRFEASHILPKHPGKCSRLHGHSWVLHVAVRGPINKDTGFVMDYADLSKVVKPLVEQLDHRHLGAWSFGLMFIGNYRDNWGVEGMHAEFYPSSENLCLWIWSRLQRDLSNLEEVSIEETCTSACTITKRDWEFASTEISEDARCL